MKKILLASAIASLSLASTIMPYTSYIHYSNSYKKDAALGGIYGSYSKSNFKVESDIEATKIKYNKNIANYNQHDFTLVGNYFYKNNYKFRAGIHNIWINQINNPASYQKVLFSGIDYDKYLKYNVGVDYYASHYIHFNVNQITPKIGYNFGNYYSKAGLLVGSFYVEAKVNFIKISDKNKAYTKKDNYRNYDIKLQNFNGHLTTTLKFSVGKAAYKVANDGFVVYNLRDEYNYNRGIDINYNYKKTNNFKVGFSRAKFIENSKNAYSDTYSLSYLKSF